MQKRSPIVRWFLVLWLLSTQTAGLAMTLAPATVLFTFNAAGGNDSGIFNFLLVLSFIAPLAFLALSIWAWVQFARRKDAAAGWFGLATLAPGIIMLMAMGLYNP
jgi:hypothetical protein